ncbi:MAG: hypothetical protein LC799_27415, partial [Actinobacteria bacterium]|nr:hypothetical protein [Actinomycetota bacterium]
LDSARRRADATSPRVLRAWLAAAHGEALAAHGEPTASLHAFDHAAQLLPNDPTDERPYVALDTIHLTRWRGHALARLGHPDATTILTDALNQLDPTFVRAQTALHVDLAIAHATWRASQIPDRGPYKVPSGTKGDKCQNGAGSTRLNSRTKRRRW